MAGPELRGVITADPSGLVRAARRSESSLSSLERAGEAVGSALSTGFTAIASAAKVAAVAGAALAASVTAVAVKSIGLAREQIRVEKQLGAVLQSTGKAAGLNADELLEMARALQDVTNFADETIIGAENILLTFTQIGRNVFPEALAITLDLAAALGTSLQSAAIQVGKALNDPIRGVSALAEAGIQFTVAQREQIKSLVESGRLMQAQRIILAELTRQFQGSAKAQADSFTQIRNAISDVGEEIGKTLIPALDDLLDTAKPIIEGIRDAVRILGEEFKDDFEAITDGVREWAEEIERNGGFVVATLETVARGLEFVGDLFSDFGALLRKLATPIGVAAQAFKVMFTTLEIGINLIALAGSGILALGATIGTFLVGKLANAATAFATFIRSFQELPDVLKAGLKSLGVDIDGFSKTAASGFDGVATNLTEVAKQTDAAGDVMKSTFDGLKTQLGESVDDLLDLNTTFDESKSTIDEWASSADRAGAFFQSMGMRVDGTTESLKRLRAEQSKPPPGQPGAGAAGDSRTLIGGAGFGAGGFVTGPFVVTSQGIVPVNKQTGEIQFNQTLNFGSGTGFSKREMARELAPEAERAARRGVQQATR